LRGRTFRKRSCFIAGCWTCSARHQRRASGEVAPGPKAPLSTRDSVSGSSDNICRQISSPQLTRSHGVREIAPLPIRSLSVATSRGAVHDRQIRSALVQFCFRHGSGDGSGICATIGGPHKPATCAGSTRTLAPLIIPTAKVKSTFRGKAIPVPSLSHAWRQNCRHGGPWEARSLWCRR